MISADSLYRISLKCVIKNKSGDVLVVKEAGRSLWDLPGGGMEHGESIRQAIARELREEVGLQGSFTYRFLDMSEPTKLQTRDVWQVCVILSVQCEQENFRAGVDADEVAFMSIETFKNAKDEFEERIYLFASSL